MDFLIFRSTETENVICVRKDDVESVSCIRDATGEYITVVIMTHQVLRIETRCDLRNKLMEGILDGLSTPGIRYVEIDTVVSMNLSSKE